MERLVMIRDVVRGHIVLEHVPEFHRERKPDPEDAAGAKLDAGAGAEHDALVGDLRVVERRIDLLPGADAEAGVEAEIDVGLALALAGELEGEVRADADLG